MSREKFQVLVYEASRIAKRLLGNLGEFHPFAVTLDASGNVRVIGSHFGDEQPGAQAVIEELRGALTELASQHVIVAAGICCDAQVERSDGRLDDAIQLRLASVNYESLHTYLPYVTKEGGGFDFGQLFASAGRVEDVFGGDFGGSSRPAS
jgi:hypothetical protein